MEPVLGTFGHEGWENDDGFDESKLPSSGYEYLRRVQLEAMQCPDVVVASFDTNSFQSKQTVHVNERSGWSPAPAGFAPSTDWQMEQAADFAEIRQKLVYHRSKLGKEDSTKLTLPKKSDSMGWCRFCLGEQTTMKIFGRKDNKKSVKDEDLLQSSDSQGTDQDGTPPLLSVVLQINQLSCRCHAMLLLCDIQNNSWEENHTALRATLLQVLEFHVEWLEEIGFSHDQGKWFYALLVCLEKPLLPETTSLLRTLARLCATLRASLESPYHPLVTPLNLMITLVSRYFGQSDLADPG